MGKTFHHKKSWDEPEYDYDYSKEKKKNKNKKRNRADKTKALDELANRTSYWDIVQDSE